MAKKLHALIVEMFLDMIVSFFETQNCNFTETCSTLFAAGKSATLTFTTENAFLTEETPVFYHKARRDFMNVLHEHGRPSRQIYSVLRNIFLGVILGPLPSTLQRSNAERTRRRSAGREEELNFLQLQQRPRTAKSVACRARARKPETS